MSTDLVRVCRLHNAQCQEDTRNDKVLCPAAGGHAVKPGQWYSAAAGAADPDVLVERHVQRSLAASKRDRIKAISHLVDEAEKNLPLRNALLLPYLHDAARSAIARSLGEEEEPELLGKRGATHLPGREPAGHRAADRPVMNPPRSNTDRGLQLVGEFNLRNLLAYRLPSGYELRDATRDQVLSAAEQYFISARGDAMRGRWLKLVADALPDDVKRVRQVLGEGELGRMYGTAEREIKRLGAQLTAPRLEEATS